MSIVNNICMDADIPIQSDNKIEHIEIIKPNTIDEGTVLEKSLPITSLPITSIPVTTTDTITTEQMQTISDNNTSINKYTRIVYIKTTKIFLLFIIFIGVIIVLMSKIIAK